MRADAARRGASLGASAVALVVLLVHVATPALAQTGGTSLVDEKFEGSTVPDPNFTVQGRTCLTGATTAPPPGAANIPTCAQSQMGPVPGLGVTPGYLQLTDRRNSSAGSILYNRPIPAGAGVIASFEQWQYSGTGADGIAFFLVDGATTLTTTGGLGGSLGYAQRFSEPGVRQGYLGVGLDAFGNFYNDGENRGNGCAMQPPFLPNQSVLVPDVITLRGPGNNLTGYCWLGSTINTTPPVPRPPPSSLGGSLRAATLAAGRRSLQITISPAPSPRVMVSIDFHDGRGSREVLNIPAPPNPPATYKFGWSGSTGGQTDIHLLRNVVVKTVVALNQLNLVKQVDLTNPLPNPIVVGSVIPYQFTLTNTGLETLTGLAVTDPGITGLTCPTDRIDPAPAPTSTVVCRGSHVITQADLDAGQFVNTATAAARNPAGTTVNSNPSTVTLPLGTTPRIAIEKFVDTPGPYVVGQSVAYRYTVTNTGTVTLNNPTVTDDKGFPVTCAPPTTLVPGGMFNSSTSCTGTYVIQAADIDPTTGLLTNTATASATPTTGGTVTSAPAAQTIPVGVDIAVTKSVSNPKPVLNEVVNFTITATNNGPGGATGVTISDPILPGVTLLTASPQPGTSYSAATGVWTIGSLPLGASRTLVLGVQVGQVSTYTNTASLTTVAQPDIDPSNDTAQATITPNLAADLDVEKTVDNPTPAVDQQVTFTVTLRNLGPSPALGVVVNDPLPAGLQLVSASASQGTYSGATGVWTVGTLPVAPPPSAPATLSITARVTQAGMLTNTAAATATNDPAGDMASATVTASRIADLGIAKSDGLTSITAGEPLTYTIAVNNAGPSSVVGAPVADTFPSELQNVTWTCAPGNVPGTCGAPSGAGNIATTVDLPVGATVIFTVMATVDPAAPAGTLTNTATVMPPAGTTDPNPGNDSSTDTTTIAPSADVVVTKTAPVPPMPVSPGTDVVFTIQVVNQGPSTATDVMLVDPDTAGLTFMSATGACTQFPCSLGDLGPGDSRSISATFQVPSGYVGPPDVLVNTATASSPTPDPVPGNNTGQASVTLGPDIAAVSVTKTNGTTSIIPGTQTTYTMVVSNQGPSDVAGVTVTDNPPAALTGVTWTCTAVSPNACGQPSGTGAISTTVDLVAGGSVTFTLTGTVSPDATGQLVNTITAQNPPDVANPTPATATDTDQLTPRADLSIVKTGPPVVVPGKTLVYTLAVRNLGPSTAVNVVVNDPTPAGLTFVSTSGACTTAFPCLLGNIPPDGLPRTITATFAVPLGYATPNPIDNAASVASATQDPNPNNNTSSVQTPVDTSADVAVTKTVSPATTTIGQTVTFTVTAMNNGPNRASGVVLTDVLPAGLVFQSASPTQGAYVPDQGQWTVGALLDGASAQLTMTAVVTQPGSITNTATKTAQNEIDPDTSNDSATATLNAGAPVADVGLLKTVDDPAPVVGADVVFTVTATNFGPGDASGVVVGDPLPAGLTFVSAVASQGTYDSGTGDWILGNVPIGTSATLTLTATVTASGPLLNAARKTAQVEPDPNPANDRASVTVNGAGTANVAVAKSISDPMPAVGEAVSFVVTVTNHGPATAPGVVVLDTVPPAITVTGAVVSQGTYETASGTWTVGSLAPTQSATLILTGTVDQPGTFTNVAARDMSPPCPLQAPIPDGCDPDPTDDTGTATGSAGLVADLFTTKTDGLTTAFAGQVVTYTIVVGNIGPSPVTDALVTDVFPPVLRAVSWTCTPGPGAVCQSASGVGPIMALVDLPPGVGVTFTASGTLATDVTGAVTNTATVEPPSGVVDPNLANNTSTDSTDVMLEANLAIQKTGPATAVSGGTVTYTLLVSNLGPSDATDVVVTDPTPAGLTAPVAGAPCAGGFPCNLGTLVPGAQRTITVTYTVVATGGSVTNTATVTSPIPDPTPGENTSTVTTDVTPAPTTTTIVTTTTVASTTTTSSVTTTTFPNEICTNCLDDDGDGLVDHADPDCCTEIGTLTVTRVRITPRRGRRSAKLRITGTLAGAEFDSIDPRRQQVSILLSDGSDTLACCSIDEQYWMRLFKRQYGFWDKLRRICPPIEDVGLRAKRSGAGFFISTPHLVPVPLAGNDVALTLRIAGSCASTTVDLRRTRSGRLLYP